MYSYVLKKIHEKESEHNLPCIRCFMYVDYNNNNMKTAQLPTFIIALIRAGFKCVKALGRIIIRGHPQML